LEVLPQSTLKGKLAYLREFFGRPDVSIECARKTLNLDNDSPLPDDVAILMVQRGASDGNHASA
jgi:hypothetical protein